jgi:methylated-DNA-[protein]-cysteine S-methyltransferase
MEHVYYRNTASPIGTLLLAGKTSGLQWILLSRDGVSPAPPPGWVYSERLFGEAVIQLESYFEGRLQTFDLQLSPAGTPFQQSVWTELRSIPYGATASYGEIARRIGRPRAARAVGAANGRNPLPIVIPCHRVIGADGTLTGYGGGLSAKEYLLALERRTLSGCV